MAHAILMPKPGQMTEECTVIAWHKNEGEPVKRGDVLFEIETDKSTMDVEAFDDGVLLRIVAPAGTVVPVNTVCGYVGQVGEAIPDAPPRRHRLPRRLHRRRRRRRRVLRPRQRARHRTRCPPLPRPPHRPLQPLAPPGDVSRSARAQAGRRPTRGSTPARSPAAVLADESQSATFWPQSLRPLPSRKPPSRRRPPRRPEASHRRRSQRCLSTVRTNRDPSAGCAG